MNPRALACLLGIAACQTKTDSRTGERPGSAAPPQASAPATSDPSAEPPPRTPVPPLPSPLPGVRADLTANIGPAARVAIGDLDGDGDREIIVADAKQLRVLDASGREITAAPVGGGIQVLVAADLDGDRRWELYAGWGQSRDHMDAKARITAHRFERGKLVEDVVAAPETSRNEVLALVPMSDQMALLVAYFDSKYMVTSTIMRRGATGWTGEKVASLRTATSYARGDVDGDGAQDLVVGRVYGDDKGIDGDAFVLGKDGARTPIPSTRGLRSLAVAYTDADDRAEVFMGDGWHQNYGKLAHGLLTWARHGKSGWTTELVEDTAGQFELMRIVPATLDGKPAIVTLGSHYVRVFVRDNERWRGHTIAGPARDLAVGDLDGEPGDEVVIVGDKSELVNLRGALKP